ncbi:MAG: M23 family metallopeptidase [Spirochaetes bacterium]|nr:M23 family metallopeptidase [Spirochaetota bacterium]
MALFAQNALPAADWRQEYCAGDRGVCMIYEQTGSTVDVYLRNKFPFDGIITTASLAQSGKNENIQGHAALPQALICRGAEAVKAASFTIIDPDSRWNLRLTWFWMYGTMEDRDKEKHPYRLPFEKGRRFRVGQTFNDTPTHHGDHAYSVDWLMPEGTPVCAARGGVVIRTEDSYSGSGWTEEYKNRGNLVEILHEDGSFAHYAHLKHKGVTVREGDTVEAGETIAYSGNTGYSKSPHLHFALFRPLNMKKSVTVPYGFVTDYSDYEVPEKGAIYVFTGASPKKTRPRFYMEDAVLCRDIVDDQPVDIADSFSPKERFYINIPINIVRSHAIRIHLYKNGNPTPALRYAWTLKKEWWQARTEVDLTKVPDPAGAWRAEIIIDNKAIGSKEFTVRPGP